ncbi:MAG: c-type cytochrome [Terracidiphilus sp.]
MRGLLPAIAGGALVVLLGAALPAVAASRSQRGASDFAAAGCIHCHSIDGVGGYKGPNLSDVGRTVKKAAIRRQIFKGGKGMPPFGHALARDEIKDLVAYLRTCRTKPAGE